METDVHVRCGDGLCGTGAFVLRLGDWQRTKDDSMAFDGRELAQQTASLAAQGVYIGTSSWKYPGWCGMIYDPSRYEYRGKFAQSRFNRDCLREYAEVFKTVCVDRLNCQVVDLYAD